MGAGVSLYLRDYSKNKFEKRSYLGVFIGYSLLHKAYRCLHPSTKRVYTSRHVVFDESVFPFDNNSSGLSTLQENDVFPSANNSRDVIESTSNCDQGENHQATSTPARTHYCCDKEPNSHKESMHNKNSNNEGQELILVMPS